MSYLPDDYEPVEDRIRAFYKDHPQGRIVPTEIGFDHKEVRFSAAVYRDLDPDPHPAAVGHAHGFVGAEKDYEKTETVAIGRALANLGYAKQGARASREEMQAFQEAKVEVKKPTYPAGGPALRNASRPATEKQIGFARRLIDTTEEGPEFAAQILGATPLELADKAQVSSLIEQLKERKEAAMSKVTRSTGPADETWYMQEPPEEVPF